MNYDQWYTVECSCSTSFVVSMRGDGAVRCPGSMGAECHKSFDVEYVRRNAHPRNGYVNLRGDEPEWSRPVGSVKKVIDGLTTVTKMPERWQCEHCGHIQTLDGGKRCKKCLRDREVTQPNKGQYATELPF